METLAKRLATTRKERGLSQAELAKKAGLKNQSNIANLESGHRKSSAYIPVIAEALGVEPLWLSEGKLPKEKIKKVLDFDESLLEILGLTSDQANVDLLRDIREFAKESAERRALGLKSIKEDKISQKKESGEGK